MKKRAAVILAEGFEEIEAITAIDILRRAGVDATIYGLSGRSVTGAHGISVTADKELDDFDGGADALVLPGGMPGATHLAASNRLNSLIKKMHGDGKIIAAICASPAVVLGPAGVLSGKRATSYPGMESGFSKDVKFVTDRVVADGNIITSKGPGTALDFALAIVKKLAGGEEADKQRERTLA